MGKPPNLYAFQSADELAPSLRTYVLDAQHAALERHQVFRVAVSGGSLPKTLAQALLKERSSSTSGRSSTPMSAPYPSTTKTAITGW
jgi:6-phosphogluconolactonase/glucosamine-6-phosphate isomerase/deaminase